MVALILVGCVTAMQGRGVAEAMAVADFEAAYGRTFRVLQAVQVALLVVGLVALPFDFSFVAGVGLLMASASVGAVHQLFAMSGDRPARYLISGELSARSRNRLRLICGIEYVAGLGAIVLGFAAMDLGS